MDRVIFRKWSDGGIIAFLPDNPTNLGYVDAYEHIGQHGEANYNLCLLATKPTIPEEYVDLLAELESIGYELRVVKRLCQV